MELPTGPAAFCWAYYQVLGRSRATEWLLVSAQQSSLRYSGGKSCSAQLLSLAILRPVRLSKCPSESIKARANFAVLSQRPHVLIFVEFFSGMAVKCHSRPIAHPYPPTQSVLLSISKLAPHDDPEAHQGDYPYSHYSSLARVHISQHCLFR